MSYLYTRKTVTTLKEHHCEYCGDSIPAESKVTCEHGIYDGVPFSRYACKECEPHVGDFWDWMDGESWSVPSDFDEYMCECCPDEWKARKAEREKAAKGDA